MGPPISSLVRPENLRSLTLTVLFLPGLLCPSGIAAKDADQALHTMASFDREAGTNVPNVMDESANQDESGDPQETQTPSQVVDLVGCFKFFFFNKSRRDHTVC